MHAPETSASAWEQGLTALTGKRLVVMGVGRSESGDDGLGPLVVGLLSGRTSATLLDAATTPENFAGPVTRAKPDVLLMVDAVNFSAPVGRVRLLRARELAETDFTTHAMSPRLLLDFISEQTGAEILVLGVQPGRSGFEAPMSEPVRQAAGQIADLLARLFPV